MNVKRNALGKGLSALLDNADTDFNTRSDITGGPAFAGAIASILIEKIETNPFQPRDYFNEESLNELAESIKQHGVIQPITVRKTGHDNFQIISGERRYRASKIAGLDYIPAYVRIANDESMLEMAIVENIHRDNLNSVEIAVSYKRLIDECNLSQDDLAKKVGKDRTTVTNYLRLLKLPPIVQAAIRDEKITMGHARAIISVDDIAMQLKIFNDIMTGNLSVRKVEELVRGTSKKTRKPAKNNHEKLPADYQEIQDRLCDLY
ncbi:MAG TPA: ParB/RepB/Spo0J family partition protein, partial [Bacteroidia bacterium]|nr:ParB/RepB/Spo0J family partition protein [Bacteroidia bacterium]